MFRMMRMIRMEGGDETGAGIEIVEPRLMAAGDYLEAAAWY